MNNKFEGHLLVSDFDGTLINSRQTISNENLQAILYFIDNGGLFCGATGRTPFNIAPYLKGLPMNCPWILFNGACLYDFERQTITRAFPLKKDPIMTIIEDIIAMFPSICVHLYTADALFLVNEQGREDRTMTKEQQKFKYGQMNKIKEPWIKFILHDDHSVLLKALKVIQEKDQIKEYHAFFSIGTYLEITHKEISKGFALNLLKKQLGNRIHHVTAIGDYLNDVEMLKAADFRAAPENAHDMVKAIVQYVTVNHDNHALADLINHLSFCAEKRMF